MSISDITEVLRQFGAGRVVRWPTFVWDLKDGGQVWYRDFSLVVRYDADGTRVGDWLHSESRQKLDKLLA